jgi:hypothetical protein
MVVMFHNYKIAYGDEKDVAVLVLADDPRGYTMEVGPQNLMPVAVGPAVPKKAIAITQTVYATFYERCYHNLVGDLFRDEVSLAGAR